MNELDRRLEPLDSMVCDLETGLCGTDPPTVRRITVTYVTDPICSACWAMEPAWRAARFHYGDLFDVRHVYGGLLPRWEGFADPANGIHGFRDVAAHWEEVARHAGQATNASVWTTDPIASSIPPSLVIVAVRDLVASREEEFLRRLREELFISGCHIARPEVWSRPLRVLGIDEDDVRARLHDGRARGVFAADLELARTLRAQVFPTLIIESPDDRTTLRGVHAFARLESVMTQAAGVPAGRRDVTISEAIDYLGTGTTAEYATLLGLPAVTVEESLAEAGLRPVSLPGGNVWRT